MQSPYKHELDTASSPNKQWNTPLNKEYSSSLMESSEVSVGGANNISLFQENDITDSKPHSHIDSETRRLSALTKMQQQLLNPLPLIPRGSVYQEGLDVPRWR